MTTVPESPRTSRYARALVRLRFVVVALWIGGAVAAALTMPSLKDADLGALGQLVPDDTEAVQTERWAAQEFGFPLLSRTMLVRHDADGLSLGEQAGIAAAAVRARQGDDVAAAVPLVDVVRDGRLRPTAATTALVYLFFEPEAAFATYARRAERLAPSLGGDARITGMVPARQEQAAEVDEALPLLTLVTLLVVGGIVGLYFRAPLAPVLTLASVGLAYVVATRGLAVIGEAAGLSIPREVEPVIVVLLFGIVTDYSIFFLSRFRHRIAEGLEPRRAAESAIAEMQGIVLTAGLIVAAGSASLVAAKLGFFQAFGPGMALAVVVGLAVALTFLPACLALFGRATLWPGGARVPRRREHRRRPHVVGFAARHPIVVAVATVILLGAGASGLRHLELGDTAVRGLPSGHDARTAYADAARAFGPGALAPTLLLVENEALPADSLARLEQAVARRPGVAQVLGPRDPPPGAGRELFVTSERDGAARMLIVLEDHPHGAEAIATVRRLREDLPELVDRAGLGDALARLGGDTALTQETVADARGDLARVGPVVLLVVFVLLALFLRALVAPLYLVAAAVLGLAAALGVTVYVFQGLLGYGQLTYYVPFAVAVLLVPLGSDYNVFLTGRIWAEARHRPLREAITVAGTRAATAISVAGIVLALSFGALAIVELRAFRELAFAMTVGLVLDAFVVRTLLVPALISLFGRTSGWPGAHLRREPDRHAPDAPGAGAVASR